MVVHHPQVAFRNALASIAAAAVNTSIRLLTWNLRYDLHPNSISVADTIASLPHGTPADSRMKYYDNFSEVPWSTRRITIANEVIFNRVDVLGTFCIWGLMNLI